MAEYFKARMHDNKSALPGLRALAKGERLQTCQFARFVIQEMETPFGHPVNGLRFRITTPDDPTHTGEQINFRISLANTTNSDIVFCYKDFWPYSPHIVLAVEPEPEGQADRKRNRYSHSKRLLVKAGGSAQIHRYVPPLPAGTYQVTCRISVSAEEAAERKKIAGAKAPEVWYGAARTNPVTVHVLPPASEK